MIGVLCPLRRFTGLDCPLCGATRATFALLRGDLGTALDHNVLYVLALPVVGLLMLLWLARGRRSFPSLQTPLATWSMVVVATAFGIVRNLPIDAISFLGSSAGTN